MLVIVSEKQLKLAKLLVSISLRIVLLFRKWAVMPSLICDRSILYIFLADLIQ